MNREEILEGIEQRLVALKLARQVLNGEDVHSVVGYAMTRWKKPTQGQYFARVQGMITGGGLPPRAMKPQRKISKQGRANIAEAQRKRWAKAKRFQRKIERIDRNRRQAEDLAASNRIRYGRD